MGDFTCVEKGVYLGDNPLTNHLITSWDIQVGKNGGKTLGVVGTLNYVNPIYTLYSGYENCAYIPFIGYLLGWPWVETSSECEHE